MCGTLEMVGQSGGASEEGLATLFTSSGLQEDRTRLLLAQVQVLTLLLLILMNLLNCPKYPFMENLLHLEMAASQAHRPLREAILLCDLHLCW